MLSCYKMNCGVWSWTVRSPVGLSVKCVWIALKMSSFEFDEKPSFSSQCPSCNEIYKVTGENYLAVNLIRSSIACFRIPRRSPPWDWQLFLVIFIIDNRSWKRPGFHATAVTNLIPFRFHIFFRIFRFKQLPRSVDFRLLS